MALDSRSWLIQEKSSFASEYLGHLACFLESARTADICLLSSSVTFSTWEPQLPFVLLQNVRSHVRRVFFSPQHNIYWELEQVSHGKELWCVLPPYRQHTSISVITEEIFSGASYSSQNSFGSSTEDAPPLLGYDWKIWGEEVWVTCSPSLYLRNVENVIWLWANHSEILLWL